jgi:hypothetical protein
MWTVNATAYAIRTLAVEANTSLAITMMNSRRKMGDEKRRVPQPARPSRRTHEAHERKQEHQKVRLEQADVPVRLSGEHIQRPASLPAQRRSDGGGNGDGEQAGRTNAGYVRSQPRSRINGRRCHS